MRNTVELVVGAILENHLRQYAKIISVKDGVYLLSGWTTRENADKANVGYTRMNIFGLQNAGFKVVSSPKKSAKANAPASSKDDKLSKDDLEKLSAKDVKAYAESIGVDNSGTKKSIIERIIAV
jgi:hypothetical protein